MSAIYNALGSALLHILAADPEIVKSRNKVIQFLTAMNMSDHTLWGQKKSISKLCWYSVNIL